MDHSTPHVDHTTHVCGQRRFERLVQESADVPNNDGATGGRRDEARSAHNSRALTAWLHLFKHTMLKRLLLSSRRCGKGERSV